jgi:hypothetical protein
MYHAISPRRTQSSAASKIGERKRDDFASPLQRLLCTDEKDTWAKQAKNPFSIKPMQKKKRKLFAENLCKTRQKTNCSNILQNKELKHSLKQNPIYFHQINLFLLTM